MVFLLHVLLFKGALYMVWSLLGKASRYRLLVLLAAMTLALLVAAPAAYASYNKDTGTVICKAGKTPALVVKAKGNPDSVRATNYDSKPVIYANYRTYSGTTTRVFYASGRYAGNYMQWLVFVPTGNSDYVSRQGTYGYCV